jgi:ribosomal-protein-alanine N-acetyltransferase
MLTVNRYQSITVKEGLLLLNHLGTQNLKTTRLLLRRFELYDAHDIFERWAKDPENVTYLPWSAHKSIEGIQKLLQKWINSYQNKNHYMWCITLKPSTTAIGFIALENIDESIDCAYLHYVLAKIFWNRGIMSEALRAILDFLFANVNFNRIAAGHDIRNPASGRVMMNAGMKFEGIAKSGCRDNLGIFRDFVNYAIIKSDWLAKIKNRAQVIDK